LGSHWLSSHVSDSYNLSQHAEVLLRSGDLAGAEFTLGEAFAFVERSKERHWPERLFMKLFASPMAKKHLMSELRGATQLARLDAVSERGQDVLVTMKAILTSISGGNDTRDVQEARIFPEDKKKIDPGP
jgi:hypothetical protein